MTGEAASLEWTDLSEGMEMSFPICVGDDDMQAFADLSGDRNPLHTDDSFAREKGFRGRVVYGGLLVAYVSRMIGMHLPGKNAVWTTLDMRFKKPLFVGEDAMLSATLIGKTDAVCAVNVNFRITTPKNTIAVGNANIIVRQPEK